MSGVLGRGPNGGPEDHLEVLRVVREVGGRRLFGDPPPLAHARFILVELIAMVFFLFGRSGTK